MDKWLGFRFQSSSGLTEEFALFNKQFKAYIKKSLPEGAKLVQWNRGHFYCFGFIERAGRFVYFNVSDVRFFPDSWFSDILVRTAKSDRDYSGGGNHTAMLTQFRDTVDQLLAQQEETPCPTTKQS